MKTLYILRHAKSNWDDVTLSDFDRPLNTRGLKAAPFMGTIMKEREFVPDRIISSPATRARETAELVRSTAGIDDEIDYDKRIYDAPVGSLLSVIAEIDERIKSALIVGHNPGLEGLIYHLTGEVSPMPTAALAVIELDVKAWHLIGGMSGKLSNTIRPKDIATSIRP